MKLQRIITVAVLLFAGMNAFAAGQHNNHEDWKQKMQSEKIAFLTMEIGLTPEEAQNFWPVYNEVNKEKDEAMKEVFKAYHAMETAIKDGKSEKEINVLLDNYLAAQKAQRGLDTKAVEKYRKVLKGEKVAKIFIAEESFRRHHIRNLHGKPGGPQPPQAKR